MSKTLRTTPLVLSPAPGQVQEAVDTLVFDYAFYKTTATIQFTPNREYTDFVTLTDQVDGLHVITLQGDIQSPGSYMWTPHVSGTIINATNCGRGILRGLELGFYVNGGTVCAAAFQGGVLDVEYCLFGSCGGGDHMRTGHGGRINVTGPYTILGDANAHARAMGGAIYLGAQPVSMPSPLSFAEAFLVASDGGWVGVGGIPYSGAGAGSATSGYRAHAESNGVIRQTSVQLPGTADLAPTTGGQIV